MQKILEGILAAGLAMLLCLPVRADNAQTGIEAGLYSIGVISNSKMFKVAGCVLEVDGDTMSAALKLNGRGYGYLYPGTAEEADAAPEADWLPFEIDMNDGKNIYRVPVSELDKELPMAAYSIKYQKWYDRTLVFQSSDMTPCTLSAPDGRYNAAVLSDIKALDGAPCKLHIADGIMTAEITANDASAAALGMASGEVAAKNGIFTCPIESLDKNIPVTVDAAPHFMRINASTLEASAALPPDGVYNIDVASDSGLLKFIACTLKVSGGNITAVLTSKGADFEKLCKGDRTQARDDAANWIAGIPDSAGNATYIMEIKSLDEALPVAAYSAKQRKWYNRTIYFDAATLRAAG